MFDAGNTLIPIDYGAVAAAHWAPTASSWIPARWRTPSCVPRVRLDPHLIPGASTESAGTHDRYLRYVLDHLGVTAVGHGEGHGGLAAGLQTRPPASGSSLTPPRRPRSRARRRPGSSWA
jgi:hypothetical protein